MGFLLSTHEKRRKIQILEELKLAIFFIIYLAQKYK